MAFRSNEYLQRNELVRFQLDDVIRTPGVGQHQNKNGYKFTINDRSSFYDWYNAYFEVQFRLEKTGNGNGFAAADRITMINCAHSLIDHLMIKSAGKIVYDTDNLRKVTFTKNLLAYSDDFSRSVAKNSFWYLDTDDTTANTNAGFEARRLQTQAVNNDGTGGPKSINAIIPLNRFSFFGELEDKMLVPMQLQFNIELQNDNELVHKANSVDAARVVVGRFLLWVPKLTPKDSLYDKFVSSFLKETWWSYLKEIYESSAPTRSSGFFQISSSIHNIKHVFVYLKENYRDANDERQVNKSPYNINTFALPGGASLSNCRLEYGNGVFYPETKYYGESMVRIFNDVMAYAMRKNDFNSGTQLNLANYKSVYPLIYFDLSYQTEKVTRDLKQLIFRHRLTQNTNEDFSVHAIVLYEEEVKIDKVGNELVIV